MLPLPGFEYHAPHSLAEALELLGRHQGKVKVIAGGTDLLPNLKHGLYEPAHLVGLRAIRDLCYVREEEGELRIGALTTLAQLARHPLIAARLPSLALAAAQVAGPQLREMGTVGGNLCLDTRCVFVNQTHFWRAALGFCLKKDGAVCHVVKGGQKCVAAASNDTAPPLMTLGAQVRLQGAQGAREVALREFYVADGTANNVLRPDELLTEVRVPLPGPGVVTGFQKLRIRAAIDYPALSVAVAAQLDSDQRLGWVKVVVSALGSRPHWVSRLEPFAGRMLDQAFLAELGEHVRRQCHPLTNINVDPAWRREVLPVLVRRAFAR
jgi:4-hydroxybenzoyl-CoA reductase subunit beta